MSASFRLEVLNGEHDRLAFACGEEQLDRYLQLQVSQDIRRRIANCFVAIDVATAKVAAYYTMSSASIQLMIYLSNLLSVYPVIRLSPPSVSDVWLWICAFKDPA